MTVAQMITFTTDHPDDIERIRERWESRTDGDRTATKIAVYKVADRDEYVQLVEFPDREAAQRNSELEATDEWSRQMREAVGDLDYVDLELIDEIDES